LAIRDEIWEDRPAAQVFATAFAASLELNSGTIAVLLDHFDPEELDQVDRALAEIGAASVLVDLRAVRHLISASVASGGDPLSAVQDACATPVGRAACQRYAEHVSEVDACLLAYSRKRIAEL
jgi:hypothetical protein